MRRNIDKDGPKSLCAKLSLDPEVVLSRPHKNCVLKTRKSNDEFTTQSCIKTAHFSKYREKLKPLTDEERFRIHEEGETLHVQCRDLEEWIQNNQAFGMLSAEDLEPPKCEASRIYWPILMKMNTYF